MMDEQKSGKGEVDLKGVEAPKATDKEIDKRAMADPKLVRVATDAHHTVFGSASSLNGEIPKADSDSVNAARD
eukprot:14486142-Alexandrium_andersonii.AAC.1